MSRWLEQNGETCWALAQRMGRRCRTVSEWAQGRALPNLINAIKIEQATMGGVPIVCWLATTLGKLEWEHKPQSDAEWVEARNYRRRQRGARKDVAAQPTVEPIVIKMEPD